MLDKIEQLLQQSPKLKAKAIAHKLGVDKKEINPLLYANSTRFFIDDDFFWSLTKLPKIVVTLAENSWVDSDSFESAIAQTGSGLDINCDVAFVVPEGCKILLDAAARLMALCNQLAWMNKSVSINFSESLATLRYLDRMGFFYHLSEKVDVVPKRPKESRAEKYKGNSERLVEFGAIDPVVPDESIPKQLKSRFVALTGEKYSQPAFTVLSELFGNVRDHSRSPILGFVALQCYKKGRRPRIQTVISDSGLGIAGTLRPILEDRYPLLAKKFPLTDPAANAFLVKEVVVAGQISQSTDPGRGLGLKRSGDVAAKFNAKISIRQEDFEVNLHYRDGVLAKFLYVLAMPRILGTHICFDFLLDE
jgi:hypothetical protein